MLYNQNGLTYQNGLAGQGSMPVYSQDQLDSAIAKAVKQCAEIDRVNFTPDMDKPITPVLQLGRKGK